LPLAEQDGLK